jgi:hypothetical protein
MQAHLLVFFNKFRAQVFQAVCFPQIPPLTPHMPVFPPPPPIRHHMPHPPNPTWYDDLNGIFFPSILLHHSS